MTDYSSKFPDLYKKALTLKFTKDISSFNGWYHNTITSKKHTPEKILDLYPLSMKIGYVSSPEQFQTWYHKVTKYNDPQILIDLMTKAVNVGVRMYPDSHVTSFEHITLLLREGTGITYHCSKGQTDEKVLFALASRRLLNREGRPDIKYLKMDYSYELPGIKKSLDPVDFVGISGKKRLLFQNGLFMYPIEYISRQDISFINKVLESFGICGFQGTIRDKIDLVNLLTITEDLKLVHSPEVIKYLAESDNETLQQLTQRNNFCCRATLLFEALTDRTVSVKREDPTTKDNSDQAINELSNKYDPLSVVRITLYTKRDENLEGSLYFKASLNTGVLDRFLVNLDDGFYPDDLSCVISEHLIPDLSKIVAEYLTNNVELIAHEAGMLFPEKYDMSLAEKTRYFLENIHTYETCHEYRASSEYVPLDKINMWTEYLLNCLVDNNSGSISRYVSRDEIIDMFFTEDCINRLNRGELVIPHYTDCEIIKVFPEIIDWRHRGEIIREGYELMLERDVPVEGYDYVYEEHHC